MFSGRGLCDELITRPEESYRMWCVVCDIESSWERRPWGGAVAPKAKALGQLTRPVEDIQFIPDFFSSACTYPFRLRNIPLRIFNRTQRSSLYARVKYRLVSKRLVCRKVLSECPINVIYDKIEVARGARYSRRWEGTLIRHTREIWVSPFVY